MLDLATIAVRDMGEDPLAVVAPRELRLGDARELLPNGVRVGGLGRAELVEPDLLVEVEVDRRPLAGARVARVVEAAAVRAPRDAPSRGPALHARNRLAALLAGGDVEEVNVAALGAILRQRHGDDAAVGGRDEEVESSSFRRGSIAFGSTTTRSLATSGAFVAVTGPRSTRIGCCFGGALFRARRRPPWCCTPSQSAEAASKIDATRARTAARSGSASSVARASAFCASVNACTSALCPSSSHS